MAVGASDSENRAMEPGRWVIASVTRIWRTRHGRSDMRRAQIPEIQQSCHNAKLASKIGVFLEAPFISMDILGIDSLHFRRDGGCENWLEQNINVANNDVAR